MKRDLLQDEIDDMILDNSDILPLLKTKIGALRQSEINRSQPGYWIDELSTLMLSYLVLSNLAYIGPVNDDPKTDTHARISFEVVCNDVFCWGCADSQECPFHEISNLWDHYNLDPIWGTAVWCIKQRKVPPQKPVYDYIKKDGIWPVDEIIKGFE